jgi:hypothetical protein
MCKKEFDQSIYPFSVNSSFVSKCYYARLESDFRFSNEFSSKFIFSHIPEARFIRISPIRLSPTGYSLMVKVQWTLVNSKKLKITRFRIFEVEVGYVAHCF